MLPSLFLVVAALAGVASAAPAPASAPAKRAGPVRVELTYNPTPPQPPASPQQPGKPKAKENASSPVNNLAAVSLADEDHELAAEGPKEDAGSGKEGGGSSAPATPKPSSDGKDSEPNQPSGNDNDVPKLPENDEDLAMWGRELMYSAVLEVGTPPQKIEVQLDTGSSDLSIWDGSNCTMKPDCDDNHPQFNPSDSSTFQRNDDAPEPGYLRYAGGFSIGYWAKDAVSVGGFKVDEQGFLAQTGGQTSYARTNVTGLLGLGFPNAARGQSSKAAWLGNVINQLPEPTVSFFLDHTDFDFDHPEATDHSKSRYGGQMILGGVDEEFYEGEITYADVLNKENLTEWNITLDAFSLNGKSNDQPSTALIDTGTTLIYAPRDIINPALKEVPGAVLWVNRWAMPCDSPVELSLTFGGREWKVPAKSMFYSRDKDNRTGENMCFLSVMPTWSDFWIVGDVFLKHVYSVFKYDPPQVGFATVKGGKQRR